MARVGEFSRAAVLSGSPYRRGKWGEPDTEPPRKCLGAKEKARELENSARSEIVPDAR